MNITIEQLEQLFITLLDQSKLDALQDELRAAFPTAENDSEELNAARAMWYVLQKQNLPDADSVTEIGRWISKAKPAPTGRDLDIQIGCHFEEAREMILSIEGVDTGSRVAVVQASGALANLSEGLKQGRYTVTISNREEFLDACADQIVTATGAATFAGMQIAEAVRRVNASNWSKFKDGEPIFDANGKIAKNLETYVKADLTGLA